MVSWARAGVWRTGGGRQPQKNGEGRGPNVSTVGRVGGSCGRRRARSTVLVLARAATGQSDGGGPAGKKEGEKGQTRRLKIFSVNDGTSEVPESMNFK